MNWYIRDETKKLRNEKSSLFFLKSDKTEKKKERKETLDNKVIRSSFLGCIVHQKLQHFAAQSPVRSSSHIKKNFNKNNFEGKIKNAH